MAVISDIFFTCREWSRAPLDAVEEGVLEVFRGIIDQQLAVQGDLNCVPLDWFKTSWGQLGAGIPELGL